MGGTKIVVLQLREIIKTAVFVIAGLLLILLLAFLFFPRQKPTPSTALYVPGTYTAQLMLQNSPVTVEVTVTEREIVNVTLANMGETQEVFYPLMTPTMDALSKEIIANQNTNIPVSQEAAVTSQVILQAVNEALAQAMPEPGEIR